MGNDILCNPFQPVVAGDKMVFPGKFPFEFLFLLGIELGLLDEYPPSLR